MPVLVTSGFDVRIASQKFTSRKGAPSYRFLTRSLPRPQRRQRHVRNLRVGPSTTNYCSVLFLRPPIADGPSRIETREQRT
jgi:hypothetical protein